MSRLSPAVGYARRSTDKQEASIADQIKAVEQYAKERGYKILRWYKDDAVSGDDTENRHEFLRMLADASERRDFETILCWDQARFGRFSPQEAGHWTYLFSKAGVQLMTTDKGLIDWNDFTGWLTYSVDQHAKHQFLLNLSRDVTRGQLEAAKNGSWIGSPPYAYNIEGDRKKKKLAIGDAAHVRIVQRIFREFVRDGRSMTNIAARLNDDGFPSPGGRPKGWRFDTVKVILENPAYTGDFVGGRYSYGKYHTVRKGVVAKAAKRCRKPEAEWILLRDHHDSIIDRRTFEKARELLDRAKKTGDGGNRKTGRSHHPPESTPYILSGLLRCGQCGCAMWGLGGGNSRFRYYECGVRRECEKNKQNRKAKDTSRTECQGTTVREDRILHSIADYLHREFLSLDGDALALKAERGELAAGDLPKAYDKIKKLLAPRHPKVDRKRIEKQVSTLVKQIELARRNVAYAKNAETIVAVEDEIERLEAERRELETELRRRPLSESDVNAEAIQVLRSLWWLNVLFRSAAQEDELDPNDPPESGAAYLTGAKQTLAVRRYLRQISAITVHTRIEGHGTRTRHVFQRGEINIEPLGVLTGNENPHHPGKSRGCCR